MEWPTSKAFAPAGTASIAVTTASTWSCRVTADLSASTDSMPGKVNGWTV